MATMATMAAMTAKKKKTMTAVLCVALAVTIAVGMTFAYLFAGAGDIENVFTFAENIKGVLEEPNWDPEEAENLTPGKKVEKDPQITNTSENGVTEYAAIKLTFLDGSGKKISAADMVTLLNLIEIDWSGNWTLYDGTLTVDAGKVTAATAEQIYVYDKLLPQGITSDPIFYSVTIPEGITTAQLEWLLGDYGHKDDEGDSCYAFGDHADYIHQASCPVKGDDDEFDTAKGGTTASEKTCNCEPRTCVPYYWHHERCALYDGVNSEEDIRNTAMGETLGAEKCDCKKVVTVHDAGCPAMIKTLTGTCDHTEVIGGLGNFTIKVEGAVVQADTFDGLMGNDDTKSYAADALVTLFNTPPTP